ncbi:MAG: hypothetical protein HYZ75_11100 [Elusimicrobia bacterium]|nr:hypothetical protein [Elusimicrobiota bacterium]
MRQDLREALSESQQGLKTHFDERFNKLAIAVDKCVPRAEFQEAIGKLDAKVDRLVVVMDRMTGELFDNSQSHVLFGAMFGDHCRSLSSHARRITALEGRLTPPAP